MIKCLNLNVNCKYRIYLKRNRYFQTRLNFLNMNYLFVAATATEIKPFINFCRKNVANLQIDFLLTGVGMLQTSYNLTKQFTIKKPGLVIQAGIAGCFDRKQELAKTWMIKEEILADLGAEENGKFADVFDLQLIKPNQNPFIKKKLVNPNIKMFDRFNFPPVIAISVNEITTSKKRIATLQKKYNPLLESMEGAAFHFVCLKENIPFVQLRCSSNYVGERNKAKWKIKEAIHNLNQELIRIVELF